MIGPTWAPMLTRAVVLIVGYPRITCCCRCWILGFVLIFRPVYAIRLFLLVILCHLHIVPFSPSLRLALSPSARTSGFCLACFYGFLSGSEG